MTLQGFAYQGNLKSAATRAVKRVSGVDDVANSIAVLPASQNDDRIRWATFYRIYLHTGECDIRHDMVAGIAVGTAAQVAMHAASGEVLVSRTVKDLVAGSGVRFEDRGEHALRGVSGDWRLYAVERTAHTPLRT